MYDRNAPGFYDTLIAEYVSEAGAAGQPLGKIAAIKSLRQKSGLGLKAAKDAVEAYGRRNGIEALAGVPGSQSMVGMFVIMALVMAVFVIVFLIARS